MLVSACGEVSRKYLRGKLSTLATRIVFMGVTQGIIEEQNRRH